MKKHYCIQSFRAKSVLMRCMKKIPLAMRCTLFMLFCLVGMTFANEGYAQKTMVNIALEDKTVDEVLTELEQGTEFVFFYNNKQIDVKRRVSVRANNKTIFKVLNDVFKGTNIGYKVLDRNIILYDKAIGADGIQATLQAATVKGSVVDATGEPVIGASILVQGTTNGVITDIDGNFILTNVGSDATLIISYVGYKTQNIKVTSQIISMIVLDTTLQQTIIAIIAEAHIILHLIRSASHRNSMRLLERQFIHKHVNPVIVCITLSPGSIQFQNIVSVFRGSLVITCPFIGQHAISISIYRFFHTRGILHTEQC